MGNTPICELKWYFEPYADNQNNPGMPQHAIIDADGYIVVGLAHMRESVAREICKNHNDKILEFSK